MPQLIFPQLLWRDGAFQAGEALLLDEGTIVAVGPAGRLDTPGVARLELPQHALLPGTVNSHNHSFQSLVRGFGDDLPFFEWRDKGIYRYSLNLDEQGVYTGALLAFGEMLRYGVTTVVDFFYLHGDSNIRDRAVMRAAQDLGIRLVLARCLYDWEIAPAVYRESLASASARCRELFYEAQELARGRQLLGVHPAPHSPHAASPAMILAGHALAQELDTPFHIHVAEGRYEVEMIQQRHGLTPIAWLDALGVLDQRAILVHCCWATPDEIGLMGQRGVSLAYNPASNMFLGDGITDIPAMLEAGVNVALGTDGACSNNRTSIFDEMRTCALLQKVRALDGAAVSAEQMLAMGTLNGAQALRLPVGALKPGLRADLCAVDLRDISLQPTNRLAKQLVYAMDARAISHVWVDGTLVYAEGELQRLPLAEIRARVAALTRDW
jgi:5-methylthioadenosine/S-adenosylhomocysteine deaminase